MEAMEGIEDIAEEQLTVKSVAKLSDSEMVISRFMWMLLLCASCV